MIYKILFLETRIKIDDEPDGLCNAYFTYPENRYNYKQKSLISNS